ncbi:hypothetical protein [Streptomyces sp. NBC_00401]|uniref:hypothetical protein n=1 Tax=Streptomyces sp. NBC_00401 TaxID=2975738 RepID=UPI00224F1197|nr:hypothetical protein [Streptomyces sp. NBC_00401]MCX5083710.1 hypothetical protein [Streptomyces sp. NBC_00401]
MNDTTTDPVEILRTFGAGLPAVNTPDDAAEWDKQLRQWAQSLLPKAREVLGSLPEEAGGQRQAITRTVGWTLRLLDCPHQPRLVDATWRVDHLTTACRLLANIVVSVGEGRVLCTWCQDYGDDPRLIQVIEAGSGPGGSLFACVSCRARYGLAIFIDKQ